MRDRPTGVRPRLRLRDAARLSRGPAARDRPTALTFSDAARLSGGKTLVHCRVGVSRSTTMVLAYVMAHLDLGLVESYLLVRSRRLNIVIQPHLLFLWELRGWETFLHRGKQAQIQLLRGRVGSPDLVRGELPREASHKLSVLSIRGSSTRSDSNSGSYRSARSSPAQQYGRRRASQPLWSYSCLRR